MPKNLLQDMVPPKKSLPPRQPVLREGRVSYVEAGSYGIRRGKRRIYILAAGAVLFLFFALSFFFSEARITITPKSEEAKLVGDLKALKSASGDALVFDLVSVQGEVEKAISGGEIREVSTPATGVAIIYNNYSSLSHPLNVNTRLEGSNGKIYKTVKKITVPGKTKDGKPGSVEVEIYASDSGAEYNSPPLDFKILGFKGTPKYDKFYGRSKGEITGGFNGRTPVISELDKTAAVSSLKEELRIRLLEKVTSQIPDGFILFKDAVYLEVKEKDIVLSSKGENVISLSLKGVLHGILLEEKKLSAEIARRGIANYGGEDIYIPNIRELGFVLSTPETGLADAKSLSFSLSGSPEVVSKVDESTLRREVLGKKKKDLEKILLEHGSVDSAEVVLRPFWKRSFPEESRKIKIVVNYPK